MKLDRVAFLALVLAFSCVSSPAFAQQGSVAGLTLSGDGGAQVQLRALLARHARVFIFIDAAVQGKQEVLVALSDPALSTLRNNVVVVAIGAREGVGGFAATRAGLEVGNVLFDPTSVAMKTLGLQVLPAIIAVDADGRPVAKHFGAMLPAARFASFVQRWTRPLPEIPR